MRRARQLYHRRPRPRGQYLWPCPRWPRHRPESRDIPSAKQLRLSLAEPLMERRNIEHGKTVMFQPAQIGFEKRPQIGNAVFQHRKPIDAETEGVTLIVIRIDAAQFEHARMDHAGACALHPVGPLAAANLSAGAVALDIHFHGRLGEREIGRSQAHPDLLDLEKGLAELFQHPFEMAEMRL